MKRIVASVGLAAIGASGLQAAALPGAGADAAKPWSLSATLRGFYDDNINTVPSGPGKQDSFGFEVSPTIALAWALEQTSISVSYAYSLRYYDTKPAGNTDHYDQTHSFNFALAHRFSSRYHIDVTDSFVIGQETDTLRSGVVVENHGQRIPGDNIRNYGTIVFGAELTPLLGVELGYANSFFDYSDHGGFSADTNSVHFNNASLSGLLDRIEHTIHVDLRWQVQPQTVGVLGYQFRQVNYIGDEQIGTENLSGATIFSDTRDSREHYVYVGADHTFRPDFTASLRIGGRYDEYYKNNGNGNGFGPYAMASLHWIYAPESYVEAGVTHDLNTTDAMSEEIGGNGFTLNEESTTVYATVSQRITPKLFANFTGTFQDSTFNGGSLNGESERLYLLGLNLEYRFNPHFSAHVGYNYDKSDSDVATRSFDRNRYYVGVTASY